jgi:hypothetical protein
MGLDFPFNTLLAQFASVNAHALLDLTAKGARCFGDAGPVENVRYFCYAGAGLGSALLFPTHPYIQAADGDNDGMVSVKSAT